MSAGMAGIIAAHEHLEGREAGQPWMRNKELAWCSCGHDHGCWIDTGANDHPNWDAFHAAHVAEELTKAGYGNVQEAKAEALIDAADWLSNGEVAGIIAYDGPSNRSEVVAAYDAALEDPESWLRERADAARAVDPAALHREERDGMAEAWREGRAAGPDALNPYDDRLPEPGPLTDMLNDPEGRALVQAIHNRKAEG